MADENEPVSEEEAFENLVKSFDESSDDSGDDGQKGASDDSSHSDDDEDKADNNSDGDNADADDSGDDDDADDSAGDDQQSDDSDDQDGADDDGDQDDQDDEKNQKKKKKQRPSLQARINDAMRQKHEAERRAEEAEARAAELARKAEQSSNDSGDDKSESSPTKSEPNDVLEMQKELYGEEAILERPDPKKFEYGELDTAYQDALITYQSQKAVAKHAAVQEAKQQSEAAQRKADEFRAKRDEMASRGNGKYDDFYEKVIVGADKGAYKVSADLALMVVDSDVGDDIAYHLASNPDEADRIFDLSPTRQGVEFARLEARFKGKNSSDDGDDPEKAKEKRSVKPSKAPTPPSTQSRGSSGRSHTSPDTEDFGAFMKVFNKKAG